MLEAETRLFILDLDRFDCWKEKPFRAMTRKATAFNPSKEMNWLG